MTDVVMNYLVKAQDLIPAEYGNYALVSAITVVGLAKAAGTMAHPGSKMVGKLELVGAILLLMGPASLGGFGHIFASWSILVAMGMMLAIKPRAILTRGDAHHAELQDSALRVGQRDPRQHDAGHELGDRDGGLHHDWVRHRYVDHAQ